MTTATASAAFYQDEAIGDALGKIPSGLFIITAESAGARVGMLASWVQQTGFHPPTVMVAVHPERELYQLIRKTGRFTVNVLAQGSTELLKTFSRYNPQAFDRVSAYGTDCGLVLREALSAMDCVVKSTVDSGGDHLTLIAEVVRGHQAQAGREPALHLRSNGFSY
ncbi:MAG: flavin reductase family protein [Vampirovibrionales bacterium]|nr:flavin reductase family protein [Vampirovibrionales bacterium]